MEDAGCSCNPKPGCSRPPVKAGPMFIARRSTPVVMASINLIRGYCCRVLANTPTLVAISAGARQTPLVSQFLHKLHTQTRKEEALRVSQQDQQYSRVGRVTDKTPVHRKQVFAVVNVGPTQFKVSPDDLIYAEKLRNVDVNDKVALNHVRLLGSRHESIVGRPFVPQASVTAIVEEQMRDAKVLIFHKRRRKNSRRTNGHRQELTALRILDINGIQA